MYRNRKIKNCLVILRMNIEIRYSRWTLAEVVIAPTIYHVARNIFSVAGVSNRASNVAPCDSQTIEIMYVGRKKRERKFRPCNGESFDTVTMCIKNIGILFYLLRHVTTTYANDIVDMYSV